MCVIEGTLSANLVHSKRGETADCEPTTGIAHTVLNNTDHNVRLPVVSEPKRPHKYPTDRSLPMT